ncbi:MAG: helix-turn-helix domain-containing protein [Chthoniobacterales bacterium]
MPTLQLVWISRGHGQVEWKDEKRALHGGDAFLLLPGHWHRYRPDWVSGWTEDWFELRGPLVTRWIERGLFARRLFHPARAAEVTRLFRELHRLGHEAGFRPPGSLAGLATSLLALVTQSYSQKASSPGESGDELVARAKEAMAHGVSVAQTAKHLSVSYPTLHRHFRRLAGMSPKQYANELRRAQAEKLLSEGRMSIKEIAAQLGYHSASHFSLAFKRAEGVSPQIWRTRPGTTASADGRSIEQFN